MGALRRVAHALDPALWSAEALGLPLDPWQRRLVMAPRGSRCIALVHRQAGKSTAASVAVAHTLVHRPRSTSLALAPTQRQSSELVRKVRAHLAGAGVRLTADNAFSLELESGERFLAMPGSDDAGIRGLSINGDLVVDEAARVSDALYAAARPMLARHADSGRLILASTAWARRGFFHETWAGGDPAWLRVEARPEQTGRIPASFLAAERRALGERAYSREYENSFDAVDSSAFDFAAIDAAFAPDDPRPAPPPTAEGETVIRREPAFARV
jgi:hypothetical protein